MRQPTEEVFLKDVAEHEMNVLLDSGVYRHLRFKQPGSSCGWFDVVTWPGHLAYAGDMGSFVFSRLEDMFEFFRTNRRDGSLGINLSYWGEKLRAVDRDGRKSGHTRFSEDRLRQHVEEVIKQWVEDCPAALDASEEEEAAAKKAFEAAVREAVDEDIFECIEDGDEVARKAVSDFDRRIDGRRYQFDDSWEWDCDDYTFRFVWCCYALAWAIRTYDKQTAAAPDAA